MSIYSPSLESGFTVTCMGKQKSDLRLYLDDRVSFAVRELKGSERADALSVMTNRLWMPVKIRDDAGEVFDLLINRSSFKKHLTSLGFSKAQIEATMRKSSFDDIMESLAECELYNKILAKNPEFNKLHTNPASLEELGANVEVLAQREKLCVQAAFYSLDFLHELIRNDFDRVEKVFRNGSFSVTLTSYYDPKSNKRVISLNDGCSDIELFSKKMGDELAEEYTLRKSHFVGLKALQEDPEHFKLTSKQVDEIVTYLMSTELKYLSDDKVDESKKSTLTDRTITYPIELSKKFTHLARTISIISEREILLVSSAKSGDKLLGEGSYKKFKKSVCLISGKSFAVSKKGEDRYSPKEIELKKRLKKFKGIATIVSETPKRVIETCYDGNISTLSSLSFDEKLKLLPKIFEGLKSLHAKGIIHRDIKPENILVKKDESGEYSIDFSDLGFSFEKGSTAKLSRAGTEYYISPEYLRASRHQLLQLTDESLDIYALGVTLKSLFELPDVPEPVARNLIEAFDLPGELPGAIASRSSGFDSSAFVSALSHDEPLDPSVVAPSLTPPSSFSSDPGSPITPPRGSLDSTKLSTIEMQYELNTLFDKMTTPQKAGRASWSDIAETLGKIGIEFKPPVEKKLRFDAVVDSCLVLEDSRDGEKLYVHREHDLNPYDRAFRKIEGGVFRRHPDDEYKILWPKTVDGDAIDTFIMGPSVNLVHLLEALELDPEKQISYSQLQYALKNSMVDTIFELNPHLIDTKGRVKPQDMKLFEYVADRASAIITDLLDEANSSGTYFESLDDLREAMIEKALEKNTTATEITKEMFEDLIKSLRGTLQIGEDPESYRIASNIYQAKEFESLLRAYHDGSFGDEETRTITMVEFNKDQLETLEYVADHVLTHPTFVSFFERFH